MDIKKELNTFILKLKTSQVSELTQDEKSLINKCIEVERIFNKIRKRSISSISVAPERNCYLCKDVNDQVASFSETSPDSGLYFMCKSCTEFNKQKRDQSVDQTGKIAIVTGGRIKIGYYTALKLLRANATVIITTRFAADAEKRYKTNVDHANWITRLYIYQVDFTSLSGINAFIEYITENFSHFNYLINNAAQTLARPPEFYHELITTSVNQQQLIESSDSSTKQSSDVIVNPHASMELFKTPLDPAIIQKYFPSGLHDEHNQQIDLRPTNSWIESIETVQIKDLIDVLAINTVTPFYLIQKLFPLMKTSKEYNYIINVSSMEGKFDRPKKKFHPHTNVAKAALNMCTRTIGNDFKKNYRIIVASIDTGWNTEENPLSYHLKSPLDCVDGAARILDPIFLQLTASGVFYKDYQITTW